jgi:hypothetical protein
VDIVFLSGAQQQPLWVGEIKWSDAIENQFGDQTSGLKILLNRHKSITTGFFTTKTFEKKITMDGRPVHIIPSAAYCYIVGRNITSSLEKPIPTIIVADAQKSVESSQSI